MSTLHSLVDRLRQSRFSSDHVSSIIVSDLEKVLLFRGALVASQVELSSVSLPQQQTPCEDFGSLEASGSEFKVRTVLRDWQDALIGRAVMEKGGLDDMLSEIIGNLDLDER